MQPRFVYIGLLAWMAISPPHAFGADHPFFGDTARARLHRSDGTPVLSQMKATPLRPNDFFLPPPQSPDDPTIAGGTYRMCHTPRETACDTIQLAPENWRRIGSGSQLRGWRYRGTGLADDPCKSVIVHLKKIKARCKGPQSLPDDFTLPIGDGAVAIELTLGGTRYCTEFHHPYRRAGHRDSYWLAKGARPPSECAPLDGTPLVGTYGGPAEAFAQPSQGLIP